MIKFERFRKIISETVKFKLEHNTWRGLLIHLSIAVVVISLAVLFFFHVYLPSYTNHLESVTVPNLEGIHMSELEDFLLKRDLRYEVNDSGYSEKFPALTILKQYPKPGSKVKEGRKIFVSVNRIKPPTVPVPELLDRSLRNAEAVLASNELKRGTITYKPSQFLNLVLDMSVNNKPIKAGDRIDKGSTIDLIVGDGFARSYFQAPELVGNNLENARFIILGSNLEIGVITVEGDTAGIEPVVLKQDPTPGLQVKIGDAINLWIGPEPEEEEEETEPEI